MSTQANVSQFQTVESKPTAAKSFRFSGNKIIGPDPREFPIASSAPSLPAVISDEALDLYAFLFCQGGFRHLGMTFEQFLLVIATLKPGDLTATIGETTAF